MTVISGTLRFYGPDCQPRHYGPGEPYVGGDRAHLARNEGEMPVEMAVTYVMAPGQSIGHFRVPDVAPTGCGLEATA